MQSLVWASVPFPLMGGSRRLQIDPSVKDGMSLHVGPARSCGHVQAVTLMSHPVAAQTGSVRDVKKLFESSSELHQWVV